MKSELKLNVNVVKRNDKIDQMWLWIFKVSYASDENSSSSAPSLRPTVLGKRRQELRGSVCGLAGGGGIGGVEVFAGARSVCGWVRVRVVWLVRPWWRRTPARLEWSLWWWRPAWCGLLAGCSVSWPVDGGWRFEKRTRS